ncbi:MAG: ankyrin repeat domain-containing protein [Bdellovibrionota bacterium]|nr:ankyrin repeat domain-containing protein [Bdellovibrionota bacterium]
MTKGLDGFLSEKIPEPEVLPVQEGAAVIFKAAKEGSLKLVKKLTEKGLWYKVVTPNRETLLHLACKSGDIELIKFLVEVKGLDVNDLSHFGSPLLEAVNLPFTTIKQRMVKTKVLAYLLSQKADVNLSEPDFKETPLLRSCLIGDYSSVSFLLDNGADPTLKGRNDTPLTKTVLGCSRSFEKEYFKIIDLLLSKGASLDEMDREGLKPIHKASFKAEKGLLNFLFDKGADLDSQVQEDNYGYGSDDIPCFVGMTPLMFGVLSKEPSTVKLLLGLGSDADIATSDEVFALDLAEDLNDEELIQALEGDIQLLGEESEDLGWEKWAEDEDEAVEIFVEDDSKENGEHKLENDEGLDLREKAVDGEEELSPSDDSFGNDPKVAKGQTLEEEDDFEVHDPNTEFSRKSFEMFDDMAEEDILSEDEKKEREDKLKSDEEDILIGDSPKGQEEVEGEDLMVEGEELVGEDMEAGGSDIRIDESSAESISEQVKLEGGDYQEKSFKMFDDLAEEDLEEEIEEKVDQVDQLENTDNNGGEEEE